jgi:hypothetical protein
MCVREDLCLGLVMGVKRSQWLVELTSGDDDDDEEARGSSGSISWIMKIAFFYSFTPTLRIVCKMSQFEPLIFMPISQLFTDGYGWLYIAVLRVIIEKCETFAFIFFPPPPPNSSLVIIFVFGFHCKSKRLFTSF